MNEVPFEVLAEEQLNHEQDTQELIEAGNASADEEQETPEEKIFKAIKEIEENSLFFIGSNTDAEYITWYDDLGIATTDSIKSELFNSKILMKCQLTYDKLYSPQYISKIVYRFAALARRTNVKKEIFGRVAKVDDEIIYNLNNEKQQFVVVSPGKARIVDVEEIVDKNYAFVPNEYMAAQVKMKKGHKRDLYQNLSTFINLNESDRILLIVAIISWFVQDSAKVVILLHGEQGSGKTILSSIIQDIVDPTTHNVLSIPNNRENMAVALSTHYVLTVDNISKLSNDTSDLLCQASTGGSYISRKKFTNFDPSIVTYKNCVILNGITIENAKPDLMDRTLKFELMPLSEKYDSAEDIIENFHEKLPEIMFEIFMVLKDAMKIYPTLDKNVKTRMFSFCQWGRAISISMFGDDKPFLDAYDANKGMTIEDVIYEDPFGALLKQYLDNISKFPHDINPTALYRSLSNMANNSNGGHMITMGVEWPANAQEMSSLMKRMAPAFRSVGYEFDINSKNKKNGVRYIRIGKTKTKDA